MLTVMKLALTRLMKISAMLAHSELQAFVCISLLLTANKCASNSVSISAYIKKHC